jgi:hypothetical protein
MLKNLSAISKNTGYVPFCKYMFSIYVSPDEPDFELPVVQLDNVFPLESTAPGGPLCFF